VRGTGKVPTCRHRRTVRLYDAGVAVFLILVGLAMLLANRPAPQPQRVVVERKVVPPGHRKGRVRVRVVTLTPALAVQHRVQYRAGLLVLEVSESQLVPLRPGDVVVAVQGEAVKEPKELRRLLRRHQNREEVTVELVRDEETLWLRIPRSALQEALEEEDEGEN